MYLSQSINYTFHIELEFRSAVSLRIGENRSTQRKTSRSKDENQQQTQPTYNAESGSQTRASLVGDECSHHCAVPSPIPVNKILIKLLKPLLCLAQSIEQHFTMGLFIIIT